MNGYANIVNPAGSAAPTFTRDEEWVRNPFWEPIAHPSDERARALYQVDNGTNKLALTVTGGNFTVDWGDGSAPEDFTAGALAEHEYLYSDTDLVGTEAPCTVASDVITHNNHGLNNGDPQSVYAVGGGSVVLTGYVVNATANTFQISLTLGGDPATIADGSYQLLSYRQAVVEIYPQAGHFIGVLDFNQEPVGITSGHNNKLLELKAHIPNCTGVPMLGWHNNSVSRALNLQNVVVTGTGGLSVPQPYSFTHLSSLVAVEIDSDNWSALNGGSGFFSGCSALRHVTMNTANVSNFGVAFLNCSSLRAIQLDTSGGVHFYSMFQGCTSLESVDIDTSNGSTFNSMFHGCTSLESVNLDTSNGTNLSSMFQSCGISGSVVFDVSSATLLSNMFIGASNLQSLTLLNIGSPTAGGLCNGCFNLTSFTGDLSGCTNLALAFYGCQVLQNLSSWDFAATTSLNNTFYNCDGLVGDIVVNAPLAADLTRVFYSCGGLGAVTINAPNSTVWAEAFQGAGLTSLDITFANGANLAKVCYSCGSLASVTFNGGTPGNIGSAFYVCSSLVDGGFATVDLSSASSGTSAWYGVAVTNIVIEEISGELRTMFGSNSALLSLEITDASGVSSLNPTVNANTAFLYASSNLNSLILNGLLVDCDVANKQLGHAALVALFTSLGDVTSIGPKTVTVTGNPGTASLTAPDLAIATSKGWTVVT